MIIRIAEQIGTLVVNWFGADPLFKGEIYYGKGPCQINKYYGFIKEKPQKLKFNLYEFFITTHKFYPFNSVGKLSWHRARSQHLIPHNRSMRVIAEAMFATSLYRGSQWRTQENMSGVKVMAGLVGGIFENLQQIH